MNWHGQCAVVIPCFNEGASIAGLIHDVRQFVQTIFVVDDGSTDATAKLAANAGAIVIQQSHRNGKGAALMRGLTAAREKGFAYALCVDGDGQHAASDIPAFFSCCERTHSVLVIGNRFGSNAAMPAVRRCVNRFMSQILSWVGGEKLPDSQCGFRLLRLSLLSVVEIRSKHFEFESELLIEVLRAGGRLEFVPIQTIYQSEQSKISPIQDAARWLSWLLRSITSGGLRRFRRRRPLIPVEERL